MQYAALTSQLPRTPSPLPAEVVWRLSAMRRAILIGSIIIALLVPWVYVSTGAAEIFTLVPLVLLYAAVLLLLKHDWKLARIGLMVTTHLLGIGLGAVFGYAANTHLLWLGTISIVYVVYEDGEGRKRAVALAVPLILFVLTEIFGRLGYLPSLMSVDTSHYSAVSMGTMFITLLQRTEMLAGFNFAVRRRLREERARLEEAQATAHVGSFDYEPASGRLQWSDELCRIHGLDPEAGTPGFLEGVSLVHPDDRESFALNIRAAIEVTDTNDRVLEYRIVRPGGEVRTVRCAVRVLRDAAGAPLRVAGSVQDVTDRKRYETDLVRAREAAEQASRAKSMFLANMSHELRTPMNGVLGMTALAMETSLTPEQREYLDAAHSSGISLLTILNDILDLSKIEAGKLSLERVSFSVRNVVLQSAQLLSPRARQKSIQLNVHVDGRVPERQWGDPVRVRQLLVNLLGNGVKFTEKGEVRLDVSCEGGDPDRLSFKVTDTGMGIPEERQRVIFEAFTQADGTTTRRFGGTGLGLTISRELARLMRGSINVESRVNVGSTFLVTLHLDACEHGGTDHSIVRVRPITGVQPAIAPRSMRVLLAEDNAVNARIAVQLVKRCGHEVTHVHDGVKAVELTALEHFDLVLMDIQMPEMDGLEATRSIRAREEITGEHLPIVAMTANAMKGDDEECLRAGMDAYLSKPLNFSKLQAVLLQYACVAALAQRASIAG